jgi:predicted negative regulator of RcsB-dependent stress response
VLALKPDYIAAHLALAHLFAKNRNPEGALTELRSAAASDAKNPAILEQIGDVEAARGRSAEARSAYQSALGLTTESAIKKRLNQKLKALPK